MILDSSALAAIFLDEPEADAFGDLIDEAEICRISAATYVELSIVVERQLGPEGSRLFDRYFRKSEIIIEPVTVEQANHARQAFLDYGKGRHPAGLNFGDCFAYALAKSTGEPLLFKGDDFSKTDVETAK